MLQFTLPFIKCTTILSGGILAVVNLPVLMRTLYDMYTPNPPNYRDHGKEKPLDLITNRKENGILSEMKKHNFICQRLGFS